LNAATPPEVATLGEFARLMRVKPSYITELKKAARLVLNQQGRVLVRESLALIESTSSPAHDGTAARHADARSSEGSGEGGPDPGAGDDDLPVDNSPHSLRRAKALADKAEIDARKAMRDEQVELGSLLRADDVRAALSETISLLRRGLEGMPDVLAPVIAATTDEGRVRVLMAEEVERRLSDVARRFQALAKESA
jgi:hypothetical protein